MSRSTRTQGNPLEYNVVLIYDETDHEEDLEEVNRYQYTEYQVTEIADNHESKAEFWNSLIDESLQFKNEFYPETAPIINLNFHDSSLSIHCRFVHYDHLSVEEKSAFDEMLESFMDTKAMSVYASCFS